MVSLGIPVVFRNAGEDHLSFGREVARLTGLEPATPGVTGRYSNRLSYNRAWGSR